MHIVDNLTPNQLISRNQKHAHPSKCRRYQEPETHFSHSSLGRCISPTISKKSNVVALWKYIQLINAMGIEFYGFGTIMFILNITGIESIEGLNRIYMPLLVGFPLGIKCINLAKPKPGFGSISREKRVRNKK